MGELWTRSRWIVVVALVAAGLAWAVSALSGSDIPTDALAVAPASASVVARIDVAAVTRSHLWNALLEEDGERGVRRIERTCGYDPLAQVEDAFVFVSGSDARPFSHVGFVARGEMARGRAHRERLVGCVERVVGGGRGTIRRIEVEGEPAIASGSGRSHAAFLGRDGVVGGDRHVVGSAIRVHRGDAPSAAGDETLRRLWRRVAADRDVVVVARLPERWLPALDRLAGQLEGSLASLAAVRGIGLGVKVRDGLAIGAALETSRAAEARRLQQALTAQIDSVLSDRTARLSAAGRALRRVRSEAQEREVIVTLQLSDAQVDDLLDLWRELRAQDPDGGALPDGLNLPGLEPDETMEAGEHPAARTPAP